MVSVSILIGDNFSTAVAKNFTVTKLNIRNTAMQEYQIAKFELKDTGTDWKDLAIDKKVIINIDGVEEFRGYIRNLQRFYDGCIKLKVFCAGLTYDLYRYVTDEEKEYATTTTMTTGEIVEALIDDYIMPNETWTKNIDTATGINVEAPDGIIFDEWKIGDCLAHLSQMDGRKFFVDWDATNSRKRINYILPSTPASPLVFSDDEADSPDRLILRAYYEESDEIKNYVIVEGGKNFNKKREYYSGTESVAYVIYNPSTNSWSSHGTFFRAEGNDTLDAIDVKTKTNIHEAEFIAKVYKSCYNISPSVTSISTNDANATNLLYMKDEDLNTYCEHPSIADGVTYEDTLSWSTLQQNLRGFYLKCERNGVDITVQKSTDGTTFTDVTTITTDKTMYFFDTDQEAIKWKLKLTNNTGSTQSVKIYEFCVWKAGYNSSRFNMADLKNDMNSVALVKPVEDGWTGWCYFSPSIELTQNEYYAVFLYPNSTKSFFLSPYCYLKTSSAGTYSSFSLADDDTYSHSSYNLMIKFGFNYKDVRGFSTNTTSITNYGQHPYVFRNLLIKSYEMAQAIAEFLSSYYSSPNNYCEIEVEGINDLNLYDKVKVYLHSLDNSGDLLGTEFEIAAYEHEIIANRWRTILQLGKPKWKVYEVIGRLRKGIQEN